MLRMHWDYVLYQNGYLPQLTVGQKDGAYSAMLTFLPTGLKGLSVAALTAAIVASLAGKAKINESISNYLYFRRTQKVHSKKHLIMRSRVNMVDSTVFTAILLAVLFTWNDVLGIGGVGGFTYIQKYTGFISPGVFAMFFLGMFWKRNNRNSSSSRCNFGVFYCYLFYLMNLLQYCLENETLLYTAYPTAKGSFEMHFHICMGLSFLFTMILMIAISFAGVKSKP